MGIAQSGEEVAVGTKRRRYDQRTSEYLVDLETGCWLWQCAKTKAGYGQVPIGGKMLYAHRVYYEDHVGPIPEGLVLDHLCKTPACCNPDHLEPVTQAENLRRTRRSHCGRGHAITDGNVYVAPSGRRQCRECVRVRERALAHRLAAEYRARKLSEPPPSRAAAPSLKPPTIPVIPEGKCQCGCGSDTRIAKKTITAKGIVKGRPMRYLRGHANSWGDVGGYAVNQESGCWIWQRSTSFNGYGQAWYKGKLYRAHRLFYELWVGPIPDGLAVDHTCGVKLCVNPNHLEAVTPRENVLRARRRHREN
jgi:hypothetical protein